MGDCGEYTHMYIYNINACTLFCYDLIPMFDMVLHLKFSVWGSGDVCFGADFHSACLVSMMWNNLCIHIGALWVGYNG